MFFRDCVEGCGKNTVIVGAPTVVHLQTGCGGCCAPMAEAFPCTKCGRLHWKKGDGVLSRSGQRVFWKDNQIVREPAK